MMVILQMVATLGHGVQLMVGQKLESTTGGCKCGAELIIRPIHLREDMKRARVIVDDITVSKRLSLVTNKAGSPGEV